MRSRAARSICRSRVDSKATFSFLFVFVRLLPETEPLPPICFDALCAMSILQSRSFRCEHLPSILIQIWISGLFGPARRCSRSLGAWHFVWPWLVYTESKLTQSRDAHVRLVFEWRSVLRPERYCE